MTVPLKFYLRLIVQPSYLYKAYCEDPEGYITKKELLNHLNSNGYTGLNEQAITSYLRGKNIMIISSEHGIKIPHTMNDFKTYVKRAESQIVPYLKTIWESEKYIRAASEGNIKILELLDNNLFKKLVGVIQDSQVDSEDNLSTKP